MFATLGAALTSLLCAHEDVFETERIRHAETGEVIAATRYARCLKCWRRSDGWPLLGVQPTDAPTRFIRPHP